MALFLSACCLVCATMLAGAANKFDRYIIVLETLAGVLLIVGLLITGWLFKGHF